MIHLITYLLFSLICGIIFYFTQIRNSTHTHKWQIRGQNRYGGSTYRICLKCRIAQKRVNKISEDEKWEDCEPITDLDSQFDENDKYIFQ